MKYFRFLGTGATCPSASRNTSSIYFRIEGIKFILDCGENTQRQILKYGENIDLDFIIITHMHADHFLGLFGLIETYKLYNRIKPLKIYCSDALSIKRFYLNLFKLPTFVLTFIQLDENTEIKISNECNIKFQLTEHTIKTFGCYIIYKNTAKLDSEKIEKLGLKPGIWCSHILEFKKIHIQDKIITLNSILKEPESTFTIFYSSDTRPITLKILPQILIHQCTYFDNIVESIKNKHTNLIELIEYSKKIKNIVCYITHISQRSDLQIKNFQLPSFIKIANDGLKHDF